MPDPARSSATSSDTTLVGVLRDLLRPVSVGFAQVRAGDNPTMAFERADKAVYRVKSNGRNAVAGYDDLVARGRLSEAPKTGDVELF
ncbi:MAG: hypothetical protein HS128_16160 [Ideonella sp.]|nr:hypothetical protein [Ideonella sp.]MCC7456833.1 hypothetical protein [Nitrospira sp.]